MTVPQLQIYKLSKSNSDDEIYDCARLINRRLLFEPNRLRDPTLKESDRIASNARSLKKYVNLPESTVYYARDESSQQIVGWIGWLRPSAQIPVVSSTNDRQDNAKEAIDTEVDKEKDTEAIKAVMTERKALEQHFFGNKPFW